MNDPATAYASVNRPTIAPRDFRPIHVSGYDREANDFYPTPAWVTEALLRHVALRGPVWEPCCGDGAIARVIEASGLPVVATDLGDRGYGNGGIDFFAQTAVPEGCRAIVTNPPYGDGGAERTSRRASSQLLAFVRHAIALTEASDGQLALLVRFTWIAGQKASALLTAGPLDKVVVLTHRIMWFDMGPNTKHGQHHHCWLFFDAQRDRSKPPEIVFG
ncbi:MAG: hypothetical protein WCI94_10065 [Rhodospirillales bacterium]